MFAVRRRRAEKVLTVSRRPDLKTKQLAAFICADATNDPLMTGEAKSHTLSESPKS
jgi:hypothetical protein